MPTVNRKTRQTQLFVFVSCWETQPFAKHKYTTETIFQSGRFFQLRVRNTIVSRTSRFPVAHFIFHRFTLHAIEMRTIFRRINSRRKMFVNPKLSNVFVKTVLIIIDRYKLPTPSAGRFTNATDKSLRIPREILDATHNLVAFRRFSIELRRALYSFFPTKHEYDSNCPWFLPISLRIWTLQLWWK